LPASERSEHPVFSVSLDFSYFDKQMKSLVNASPLKIRNLRAAPVNCGWRVLAEDKLAGGVAEFDMFIARQKLVTDLPI
jgi:hypothetical protein